MTTRANDKDESGAAGAARGRAGGRAKVAVFGGTQGSRRQKWPVEAAAWRGLKENDREVTRKVPTLTGLDFCEWIFIVPKFSKL